MQRFNEDTSSDQPEFHPGHPLCQMNVETHQGSETTYLMDAVHLCDHREGEQKADTGFTPPTAVKPIVPPQLRAQWILCVHPK